ncbi:MAG: hypothetical protein COU69_00355 [Candidatus Pacebacteria bacterium CG10_big_fil_rev_8_21_14_0_10_56_10]|nr:MAG: hypothetical protein COU69_00355 [Candidatus Pacebacteria bacterium CG10_big_fil_rev_8_21_14_0_10_56_10]
MEQDLILPLPVLFILRSLTVAGHQAYIVGGAVRDVLVSHRLPGPTSGERTPSEPSGVIDFDFTTDATPDQIMALFPESFYENEFGTVSLTHRQALAQLGRDTAENAEQQQPAHHRSRPASDRIIDLARAGKVHRSLQRSANQADDDATASGPGQNHPNYQITTFRSESSYHDHRRPSQVSWGSSLSEDLARRDFTINAMALAISPDQLEHQINRTDWRSAAERLAIPAEAVQLIDPFGGQADIQQGTIKTVGDPHQRFQEDALRMLRAVRLSAQLNMGIDEQTFDAICRHRDLIGHVSWERIGDEFMKMLATNFAAEAIELLDETGLLAKLIPELLETKGVEQGGHHTTDVWRHSLDSLRECPSPDAVVRLATLFHDISKPQTQQFQKNTITFYNHEVVGARIAKSIAKRLRLSKKDQDRVFTLVRYHMFHYQPENTDGAIRRFMRKVNLDNLDDILDLREADRLGSGAKRTSWRLEEMKQRMIAQLHQPLEVTDLAINGHDLIRELGLKPGPEIGTILDHLFEVVLEQPEKNTRDQLLSAARQRQQ